MIKSALWMIGALTSFSLMAIGVRELSGLIDTFQVLFFRSVIGLFVIALVIACSGKVERFRTDRPGLHGIRNIVHFAGSYGWFLGIGLLPLAEVFALEFTVPLWTALIACLFLNEQLTVRKVFAIILGMVGVVVIVQPGSGVISHSSLIVLGAAICYAVAHSSTKSLAATEHPLTILFYMCLVQLPIGLCFSLLNWQNPTDVQWFWITVIGISALTAHFCMAKAMQTAEATVVVTMDFLRLPAIAMVGVAFYAEPLEIALMVGALLMLLGNLLNMYVPENKHGDVARTSR
ncbi:membrane protein [Endozoicomonas elysicola]|uniref:Membrane protein n=2 Tax=Endozoicomonas elysicola TaxID=305900 RepID=A0A081KAA2_9GAMM|nr:membrane protein [Endozoicomonas elysicola]